MLRIKIPMLLLLLLTVVGYASDGNNEFRATWVITWEHISASRNTQENMARVRKILDNLQTANMNAVLWQVRQGGTSYYRSNYEPWGPYAGYRDPGFDPLAYTIQEAHKRGMEVHAWFNTFHCSETVAGAPAQVHPEWVCRNSDGQPMTSSRALSPGLKQVRDYTVQVAMDIARRYDLDGFHLDYVRWNEETGLAKLHKAAPESAALDGIITAEELQVLTENAAARFLYDVEHPYSAGVPTGFSSWEDWWRWSVTEFVHTLHDSIQSVKPWVRLSAAALGNYNWGGWQGYGTVFQDAALWFNKGYVDQLMPMHYSLYCGYEFLAMLVNGCPQCWGQAIQEGIAKGRFFSVGPGSYQFGKETFLSRHQEIVNACRQVSWVDGFQFFSYGSWEDNELYEKAGMTFFANKTKMRAAKFLQDSIPPTPSMILLQEDSLHYRLRVQPATGVDKDQWYVIYRAPEAATVQKPEILNIHFGHESFDFQDAFTGTQDYDDRYVYYATASDRFWNESSFTPVLFSDLIPSFAPTVIKSVPAGGDTIDSKTPVVLSFSKTMDISSFQNAVAFDPPVTIGSIQWSADQRICTISSAYGFNYNRSYTLRVSSGVKDINGKTLDGNGDGKAGDPFSKVFYIMAKDQRGPQALSVYPIAGATVLPEEVLSMVFDEPPAGATLTESSLILKKDDVIIPCTWNLTRLQNRTVLSVQPKSAMELNSSYQLSLTTAVTDTLGNAMATPVFMTFSTGSNRVKDIRNIDQFLDVGYWKAPTYSGSTVGVRAVNCTYELSKDTYLPNVLPRWRNAAALRYEWDPAATTFLLREYMDVNSAGAAVKFDSSNTLQCFVFGDGSATRLRFALDDAGQDHEVSQWITVDWYGWRLLEWKLSDPASFGTWIGNGIFSSNQLNIDSIQLTRDENSAWSGKIYFDDLRVVKKTTVPTLVVAGTTVTNSYNLMQNFPNPFNMETVLCFSLPVTEKIQLSIHDVLGRQVAMVLSGTYAAGSHEVRWNAEGLASGVYLYTLQTPSQVLHRKMILAR